MGYTISRELWMVEAFDAWQYINYLKSRWRFISLACISAVSVALLLSLLLPKKFTATARILIEPPAGTDIHSAMAVSPIYLESLKTYEHFAASDSLFARAIAKFRLRERLGNRTIESLKGSVLQVSIPRVTRILEVRITLPEPTLAQAVAQYVAEETVEMNRSLTTERDRELVESVEKQFADARAALNEIDVARNRLLTQEPVQELPAEIEAQQSLRGQLKRQLLASDMDAAELADRAKRPDETRGSDPGGWLAGAQIRIGVLQKQLRDTEASLARNQRLLAERRTKLLKLDANRKSAEATAGLVENRLQQVRSTVGFRGERLEIIDPAVVPERPSFPNLPLNVASALLLALVTSILYLTLEFAYHRRRVAGGSAGLPETAVRRND